MKKIGSVKRVVGVLLGSNRQGVLDVSNSFAVPFDEDEREADVWFLDHDYLENMYGMFKKVNAREKIVGWYHTGPKLKPNDVIVNELVRKYCPNSVLVVIDAEPKNLNIGLPTEAYIAVEEVHDDGTPTTKTFEHVPSEIGAEEAEEVGVEHLLRDIKDTTVGTLSQRVTNQLMGLKGLFQQLHEIHSYLDKVASGQLPVNHQIVYLLQDVFNLLPDVNLQSFVRAVNITTNDQMLVVYVAALIRSVIALHNLITNKLQNRDAERSEMKDAKDAAGKKKEAAAAAATAAGDDKKSGDGDTKKDGPADSKTGSSTDKQSSSKM
jgi:26S proteasome regulatory subunit N8